MLIDYLPTLVAVIVAVVAAYGNYRIGKLKSSVDVKTLSSSASDELRDDLLAFIDKYEKRETDLLKKIEHYEEQNQTLQDTVNKLRLEITALRIENQGLAADLQTTRNKLDEFDRKVYYRKEEVKQ